MREKIEQLSRGKFNYITPNIVLSVEKIDIYIEEGKDYYGSFTLKNSEDTLIQGIVYSLNGLLTLPEDKFSGIDNEIKYQIHGLDCASGEVIETELQLVSDCGEILIPVHISIEAPYCITSLGKMKDMFHFTSLAKEDWMEALKLFKSDEFERVFLHNDSKNLILYKNLIPCTIPSRALEEFLVGVHKKVPINIRIERNNMEYEITSNDSFMDKIVLLKDNWGYLETRISTDSPFISLEHKIIWSDNFIGSTYNLEFVVDPQFLRDGKNFGQIYLTTYQQTMIVDITCHYVKETRIRDAYHLLKRRFEINITQEYLGFRTGAIKLTQYLQETEGVVNNLLAFENNILYDMLKTHLYIISSRAEKALFMLEKLKEHESDWKRESGFEYCAYLYLNALYHKEEDITEQAVIDITNIYENGHNDWRILWFLLYLDKKYEENSVLKLARIKEQVIEGTHSPFLYLEALNVYHKEPSLLRELDTVTLQILNYGIRKDCIDKEVADQFTYLAAREKNFSNNVYKNLVMLYDKRPSKDILTAICTILIKGQKTDTKYFPWYQLGVEEQLKLTQLAECYMYSLEEGANVTLPSPILMYFVYNSNLSDNKKAFLYAYIINHKVQNPSIYNTYLKQMENFCIKQIGLRNINRNLAIIYDELGTQDIITKKLAHDLPHIMFRYDIQCNNQSIKGISVVHKELCSECFVSLIDGEAQINICTENAEIFLIDYNDNRYLSTIEYTLNQLMNPDKYIQICYSYYVDNPMLLLYMSEKLDKYQKLENAPLIREKVFLIQDLRPEYYKRYLLALVKHYYDSLQGDLLETYLLSVNLQFLNKWERAQLIEYTIIQGMYRKALSLIEEYGYAVVSMKRLLKLCNNLIQSEPIDIASQTIFIDLCFAVFQAGKYDEVLLNYLIVNYNGATKDMYILWKFGKEFSISTTSLEERLLDQMLFAQSYIEDAYAVFESYYKEGHNQKLIKAFLSFYAYRYLVHDRIVNSQLFHIMQKELVLEENQVSMLALLKYLSTKYEISEEEKRFVNYHIHEYLKKGFILPFFKDYKDKISLPQYIIDKQYIEYRTDPKKKVVIHYRINEEGHDDFIKETMENVYLGIHVKEFVIFYNEEIQYYITEEEDGNEIITESTNVKLDNSMDEEENTKYNSINLMIMARELKDDKTLIQTIENHIKNDYLIRTLFKIK